MSLETALADASTPFILIDRSMVIRFTSRGLDELFHYPRGALAGQVIHTLLPQDSREHHSGHVATFFDEPNVRQMGAGGDLMGLTSEGVAFPVKVGLTPVEGSDETLALAQVTDIGPHRAREAQFRIALNAAAAAILLVDADGTVALANDRCQPMFGYSGDELMGQPVDMLLPASVRKGHAQLRHGFHQEPSQRGMGADRTLRALHADGTEFPVAVGLTPVGDSDEQVLCTVSDITASVAAAEALEKSNELLSMKNTELAAFVYSASHDLKAPLLSVGGLLRLMGRDLEQENYAGIGPNVGRMNLLVKELSNTVRGLLDVSGADHLPAVHEPVNIGEVIDLVMTRQQTATGDVKVQADLRHTSTLIGSSDRMRLIIDNLVSNGCKYRHTNRKSWVRIETEDAAGQNITLRVSDNGLGIPERNHPQVFDMFRRFHKTTVRGSGLGLALVRKHVTLMGGTITFSSSPLGTAFEITLPLRSPN